MNLVGHVIMFLRNRKDFSKDLITYQPNIKSAFNLFDKDSSGFIDAAELKTVLQTLKQNPTDKDVEDMIAELDKNGNKKIEYDEFEKFMADKFKSPDEAEEEMRNAFKIFDKDGSGKIDAKELRHAMKSLGETMTDEEVDEMIKAADQDSDGKVDYSESQKISVPYNGILPINIKQVPQYSPIPSKLPEEIKQEFREAFELFDKDGSGYINSRELLTVMRAFKQDPTKAEVQHLMQELDTNGNGKIEYEEFEKYMADHYKSVEEANSSMMEAFKLFDKDGTGEISFEMFLEYAPSKFRSEDEEMSMVKEAFRVFDKDGSGYITIDEAKSILQRGENSISDEDLQEFFNQSDLDKDGQINYEEIRDAFDACDHDGDGTVDAGELKRVMRACGQNASTSQIQDIINDVDHNGNGSLEFSEFLNLVKDIYQDPNKFETEIKEAFQRYDQDGNGVISQPEFKHLITSFDDKISDEEMKDLLSKVEMDKDGNINYDVVYYYPGDERVACFGLSNSVFTLKQDSVGHLVAANR
uniref:Sulfhydryl light chain n=1 Tax=Magallana gigas TaxID=29159 RepID=K1R028_MAGGI